MFTKDQIKSVKKLEFNSNHYGYTLTIDSKVFNIPISENNTEYQIIKEWIAEGNTVDPAD